MSKSTSGFIQFRIVAAILIVTTLVGCAAQRAFRDGKTLVKEDKVQQGLQKIQEASAQDPQSMEYRTAYMQTRDGLRKVELEARHARLLGDAQMDFNSDDFEGARKKSAKRNHPRGQLTPNARNHRQILW